VDQSHNENRELAILKSAVENTNEAFVTIDESHKVIFFNKAAEMIFGYSREEVVGHDLDIIMAPGCSRDHRRAVDQYVKTGIPKRIGHATELIATRKGGEKFPADISFSVSEVAGKLYFTGIVSDITEKKALQKQIVNSERLAALGQVAAEITHEIKNPLMMIGGFANQLIRQPLDEKTLSKLNIIAEEVSRLEDLLEELKQFHQPGALRKEKIDINDLFSEVFFLTKQECHKKGILTELKKGEKPLIVEGDRDKLKQVFLNLVKNSIEAMKNGGNLSVRSGLSDDVVEIKIEDDGCGIGEDDMEKIFSPFYTTKQDGTGLGLSISKSIIEAHEGSSFTLQSKAGKGTTFRITMPVCRM
jgi:two-component system sensor kinase FixL